VLGLIVLIALVMLFAMTRSVVLPLMAVVMNILTIGATFGMLVWAFQWGHLSHLLGFSGPGALQSTSLIIILAVVFGLVDRLRRLPARPDEGGARRRGNPDEAVALGLDRTGGIVSAAAPVPGLAMGALVLSRLVFVKELGLGVAFAVLLDATVVRAVLVPVVVAGMRPPTSGHSLTPPRERRTNASTLPIRNGLSCSRRSSVASSLAAWWSPLRSNGRCTNDRGPPTCRHNAEGANSCRNDRRVVGGQRRRTSAHRDWEGLRLFWAGSY
jgi:hypothetical protein